MNRLLRIAALLAVLPGAGCLPDGLTDYDFDQLRPPREEPEAPRTFEPIGEAEAGAHRVVLYAEGGAHAGYVRLRIGVEDAMGAVVEEALVTLAAEVRRGDAFVPAPVEGPASTTADAEGYFPAAAYLLPEAAGDPARLRVRVNDDEAVLDVAVEADPLWEREVSDDGVVYHAAWVAPQRPIVGDNTFEARLFEETSTGFAPLGGSAVQLYPYMDMGGGDGHSTPFTPPFEPQPGLWRCQVNFIMSGGWELSLYVRRDGLPRDTIRFVPFTVYDR